MTRSGQGHLLDGPHQDDESGSVLLNEARDTRSLRQASTPSRSESLRVAPSQSESRDGSPNPAGHVAVRDCV